MNSIDYLILHSNITLVKIVNLKSKDIFYILYFYRIFMFKYPQILLHNYIYIICI